MGEIHISIKDLTLKHMGQNASDWLQMEQTSLLVQTAVRLAAADYTDPSWWAGEFQEVENKGLGWSEMFLGAGNRNLHRSWSSWRLGIWVLRCWP